MARPAIALLTLTFCLTVSLIAPAEPSKGDDDPYAVIIRNNLFRPLGWKPNPSGPSYQLLGTVIVEGGPNMAIISLGGKAVYYVKEGEKVGKAVLKRVEEKRAVLVEEGKEIELKIDSNRIGFLSTRGRRPSKGGPSGEKLKPEKPGEERSPQPKPKGPGPKPLVPELHVPEPHVREELLKRIEELKERMERFRRMREGR